MYLSVFTKENKKKEKKEVDIYLFHNLSPFVLFICKLLTTVIIIAKKIANILRKEQVVGGTI